MDVTAQKKKGLSLRLFEGKIGRAILIASFVILTVGLPLAYLFTKNQTPVASWYDNGWEYRKPISITNTGGAKTNYDVLVTLDTAALISSGKIQNDCDDIRFVDTDDTTVLSYWIESGCNASDTQIWVRVPTVDDVSDTIYMYYGNGSALAGQTSWAGNVVVWYQSSCPVGWTRVSAADGRFIMGSAAYGSTGGTSTHLHGWNTITLTGVTGTNVDTFSYAGVNSLNTSHTHGTPTATFNSSSHIPTYLNWVLCSKPAFPFEAGSIGLSESASVTGWTRVTEMDSKYPMGAATYGGGGGSDTHVHTITAGSTSSTSGTTVPALTSLATGGTVTTSGGYYIHTFTSSGTFSSAVNMNVEVLVVGGGGGGGAKASSSNAGGGGGGGQVIYNSAYSVIGTAPNTVTIGAGGAGGVESTQSTTPGTNGGNTIFGSLTAIGGGGGGGVSYAAGDLGLAGKNGGNGGGGGGGQGPVGGTGTAGYNGGIGSSAISSSGWWRGGGGGGAGGVGASGDVSGNGGVGYNSSISGVSAYYGGGGGGGRHNNGTTGYNAGSGGAGGGGAGSYTSNGVNGTANTGGGGGGGGKGAGASQGGAGGSGIVIVRYPAVAATITSTTHTHTVSGTVNSTTNNVSHRLMVYQSKDTTGTVPSGIISMFSVLPPFGWERYSYLDSKFARGSSFFGAGSGANHSHSVNLTYGNASGSVSTVAPAAGNPYTVAFPSSTHSHTSTAGSRVDQPQIPYFTSIFGKKIDNSATGVSLTVQSEQTNVPTPPTMTAAEGLSTTSIRWNFIDTADNETGFKVYDMSGVLKVICVGVDRTYCDETGLSPNTQYERQIKAFNANGDSLEYSSSTSRYTLAPAPTATITGVSESSATVEVGTMNNYNADQSGWYFDCLQVNCDNGNFNTWVTVDSQVDTGLQNNTQYSFRVKARNGDGVETSYSTSVDTYTHASVPVVSFSDVTFEGLTLSVQNVNNFGSGQSAALFECTTASSPECDTGGTWQTTGSQALAGLDSNKEYSFRAKVRNGDGVETTYSLTASTTTLSRPPLAVQLSDATTTSIKVTLNADSNGNPSTTEYVVRYNSNGQYLNPVTGLLQVSPYWGTYADFGSASGVTLTGLEEGVAQIVSVKARNVDQVETAYSSNSQIFTYLKTPTLDSAQALSSTGIRWNFTDNTNNETGFRVYDQSNNLVVTCNGINLTYCDETSLSPNTSYTRKVVAFNSDVESGQSGEITKYTRTNTPDAPTLSFGSTQSQITINTNNNPVATLYSIMEQSGLYVQSDGTLGVSEVKKTLADWATITVTGLTPNTSYSFAVKAENGDQTHQTTSSYSTGYTLSTALIPPTVTGVSTTSANVEINYGSNPGTTQFAIYHVSSNQYVDRTNGQLVASEVWGTYAQWGGTSGINVLGLTVNTLSEFKVKARNGDGVEGSLSDSGSGYTYANVPSAPTLSAVSTTVLKTVINQNSNPSNTLYAVQINGNLYINHQTGTTQASPSYATYQDWGGVDGVGISGLTPDGNYSLRVLARNGDGVNTSFSSSASLHTLANVPGIPELTRISSTSANLTIDRNGNPSSVVFAILEVNSGKFVQQDGTFGNTVDWGTYIQWGSTNGITMTQLTLDTSYEFRVKARNSDDVETAYSSSSNAYSSLGAPVIGTPTVIDATTIRWNFSETLSNELGFRVLNEQGDQVAQCPSSNLTYCDEFGLTANTSYTRYIVAYDGNGNGDISENSAQATTFALVPSAPTVSMTESPTTLSVKINVGSNNPASSTNYVIRESVSGNYVNNLGELVASEYKGTYSTFGGDSGLTVSGLFANARYVFDVKAVNSQDISTEYSGNSSKYTRVAPLGVQVLEAVNETSLRIKIGNGGNPPFTQYQIKDKASGKFVPKNGGALTNTSVWGTYSEFGQNNGVLITGLTPNTAYTFEVSARNGDLVVGSTVDSNQMYTFASRPDALLTNVISPRAINITLPTRYAQSTERFAIWNSETGRFINQAGEFVETPVWLTYAQFGGVDGVTVAGLVPGKGYTFFAKTRNISNVETQYSNATLAYTQPLPPEKPNADVVSTTGARIFIIEPGNDPSVLYAVYEVTREKFVSKVDGTLVDAASWGTYEEFGGSNGFLVKGLPSASDMQFKVRARNLGQVNSAYSAEVLVQTNALIYNVPAGVKVTLAGDENVDVSKLEGSQRGVKTLEVKDENILLAELDVKFDSDKDWNNIVAQTDEQSSKSVLKLNNQSGVDGTFTLYTPANTTQKLRICPGSSSLSEVTSDCEGGVLFSGIFPQSKTVEGSEVTVSKEEIDGKVYWVAAGLTGTGALGELEEGKEPTDNPTIPVPTDVETDNPLVIEIPVDDIVANINNETVKNVAKVVLTEAPQRTVLAMKQVSNAVDNTVIGSLDQPQLEVVSTVATATTVTVGLAVLAGGFVNIPYLIAQLIISALSFLGFVKKSRPYGLVYDSVTKKPIDRAVVRVYNMGERLVWTDVTSAFGTFGANLPIGKYKILVVKPGYKYPSQIVIGPIDYPLEPVYHGEVIKFNRRNEFNLVIPMDPIEKTGFAKTLAKIFSNASILVKLGHIAIFLAGFLLGVHTVYQYPSSYNFVALLFYIPALFLVLRNIFVKERSKGMVIDRNGNPIEGVTVTLKEMKFDKYVAKRITDKNGEYQMIVPNGTYQLGIMDDEYRAVRYEGGSSIISRKRKGKELVIDRAIIVKKK